MRLLVVVAAVVAAAQLVAGAVDIKSIKRTPAAHTVPGSYIVTLTPGSHLKRGFDSPHAALYSELKKMGATWKVTREYSNPLMTGAAVTLGSASDLVKLAQASGVEAIAPNYIHPRPQPVARYVGGASNTTAKKDTFEPHVMTGVDKLHAKGILGQDVKIGIIDSGIDYTHPLLGGNFGPGNKVAGGYDFVGDNYTGAASPAPDPDNDPLDQCEGHGTHVAGIIAADPDNPYGISGVAYKAVIYAYRIFGCKGGTSDEMIIAALLGAYKDGCNILTLSLGGPAGWTESMSGVVASRIAKKGRVVTIAAGNDGQYGSWYTSSPGTGIDVISVGSVDNTRAYVQNALVSNKRKIQYLGLKPLPIPAGLALYATSPDTNVPDDACNPLPATTPNLSNRLVVIRRGTCPFAQKMDNAAHFGGKYFCIYDNQVEDLITIDSGNYTAAFISLKNGIFLVAQAIPQCLTLSFPDEPSTTKLSSGGLMSSFSSYGPTYDMYMKPAVSAPGGNILSTYPVPLGKYAVLSGTSMSTPFIAGVAALYFQVRGKTPGNARAVRGIFENTSKPLKQSTSNTSLLETAAQQGAGLIDAYHAVYTKSSMHPAELRLNDTKYFKNQCPSITNWGKKSVTYKLSHIPAGTATTIEGIENIPYPVPLVANYATVTFERKTIEVQPGCTVPVKCKIHPPAKLDPKTFPVYSGYIQAKGSDGSSIQSTYLGVAAPLKDMKVIDNTDRFFGVPLPLVLDKTGNPIDGPTTYTMKGDDFPVFVCRFVAGTPHWELDTIPCDAKKTSNQRRSLGELDVRDTPYSIVDKRSIKDWMHSSKRRAKGGSFYREPTTGTIFGQDYAPRNTDDFDNNGYDAILVNQFANGTTIPNGCYRLRLHALKITGNPKKEEDYEKWESQKIIVKRA